MQNTMYARHASSFKTWLPPNTLWYNTINCRFLQNNIKPNFIRYAKKSILILCFNNLFTSVFNSNSQGHTQVNFVSTLLRVTMSDQLDLPVRQAGESTFFNIKIVLQICLNFFSSVAY